MDILAAAAAAAAAGGEVADVLETAAAGTVAAAAVAGVELRQDNLEQELSHHSEMQAAHRIWPGRHRG